MWMRNSIVGALALMSVAGSAIEARQQSAAARGAAGTVTLPVADYDLLLDRAAQPPATLDTPPVPAVVGRASLRARVDASSVRGTLELEGEVFQRGAVKVPLVTGATLLDARADGQPLPLLHEGDVHAAVLAGPAPFSVILDWATALGAAPGRASFVLPQAASASISAIVDLPGDPADVRVEPGLITRRQTAGGRTTIEIALDRVKRTQISWSVRETTPAGTPAESRTLSDVRSLMTIGDGFLRLVALLDVTVVRGEPRTFDVQVPAGYEVAAATGASLESSDTRGTTLTLTVRDAALRRHQFLVSLERPQGPGSFKVDTSFPTIAGVQRETGEAAIEATGTVEVVATGDDALRRMDVREVNARLRPLARQPLLAAFRYQRRPNEARVLTLDVRRFADAPVIPAAAERGTATTLVTSDGRTLTEVTLRIRNRAQPFMKVTLPPGATMHSVEVAGEPARPVEGADGMRIPLLRAGLLTDAPYTVSFVYLHAGQAFAKRGDARVLLPIVDVPISVLEWELFLPGQYSAKATGGNVMPADVVERTTIREAETSESAWSSAPGSGSAIGTSSSLTDASDLELANAGTGQIVGRITDSTGAAVPGVTVTVTSEGRTRLTTVSGPDGSYVVHAVPSGAITVTSELRGFSTGRRSFAFDQKPRRLDFRMEIGDASESVNVRAEAPTINTSARELANVTPADRKSQDLDTKVAPSQNVINLQRRVAGVLPVRVDVPRAGTQYRFIRPLVIAEETTVSFRYKTR
jgi:hypothetical protein